MANDVVKQQEVGRFIKKAQSKAYLTPVKQRHGVNKVLLATKSIGGGDSIQISATQNTNKKSEGLAPSNMMQVLITANK